MSSTEDHKMVDEKIIGTSPDGVAHGEVDELTALGYTPELRRNRSLFTLLFQTLAIAAIPYGEGGPLISAIYGGGQLSSMYLFCFLYTWGDAELM